MIDGVRHSTTVDDTVRQIVGSSIGQRRGIAQPKRDQTSPPLLTHLGYLDSEKIAKADLGDIVDDVLVVKKVGVVDICRARDLRNIGLRT